MKTYLRRTSAFAALLTLTLAPTALAQEQVDAEAVALIRRHGLEQSRIEETLWHLTELHGPRLTGSPKLREASEWAIQQYAAWGIPGAKLEAWGPFGRGWSLERFSMQAVEPTPFPVIAVPAAWSPDIEGPVMAEVVVLKGSTDAELAASRGKLKGKVVLLNDPRPITQAFEPTARRRDEAGLAGMANDSGAEQAYTPDREAMRRSQINQRRARFAYDEQPLAVLAVGSKGDNGTVFGQNPYMPPDGPRAWDEGARVVPQIAVAAEHYNRLYRLADRGLPVQVELNLDATFYNDDPMEHNVIAEMKGTSDEVVMLGAHLDSWHGGTGATDNAAGSAVVMEAMRILKQVYGELGRQPRRTIRAALWTGEEQGLFGSFAYVGDHFAEIEGWGDEPAALKPEHAGLSAYYNLDNGTGKIRGVYLQGNEAVAPIFRAWLAPFHDLGAATLTIRETGGTDHLAFDAVGLPGFQFIQDPIAYSTRTHHSNMDVYDNALPEDLKQAAVVMASFVYHTAERDERLPREPSETGANPSSGHSH